MSKAIMLDPEQLWWVCWRIEGELCARSLAPAKTAIAVECAEKVAKVWPEVWLEKDTEQAASPAAPGAQPAKW